jgi:hypothetical protein
VFVYVNIVSRFLRLVVLRMRRFVIMRRGRRLDFERLVRVDRYERVDFFREE